MSLQALLSDYVVGTGGATERLARNTSLQSPHEEQIKTLRQLYEQPFIKIPSVTIDYFIVVTCEYDKVVACMCVTSE
jgi:hypothetical protein